MVEPFSKLRNKNYVNNLKKDCVAESCNNSPEQEEETLRILSEIICNIIIKEINHHEEDESIYDDTA